MTTTAITGKKVTVTYGGKDGSAQITTASIDESASSNVIQTLGGSVALSQGVESSVSADFLYDGDVAGGGFYAVLKALLDSGGEGDLSIDGDGSTWTGKGIVTSLGAEMPADDAVTCSAELTISGKLAFAPGAGTAGGTQGGSTAGVKGAAAPGASFIGETDVTASDATNAAKLAGLGYIAAPATAWTAGQKITIGALDFHWTGTEWAAGAA